MKKQPRPRANPRKIARLEYDLGFTDQEPPDDLWDDGPGKVITYSGKPPTMRNIDGILRMMYDPTETTVE